MDQRSKEKIDIDEVLACINEAFEAEEGNNASFNLNKRMIYESSLTEEDKTLLKANHKSTFSIPVILPQLNHQLKNIQDSVPSASVEALHPDYERFCDFLTNKLNSIFEKNDYSHILTQVASDMMSGGKGIFEVKTEYTNNFSMDQKVTLEAVPDPTRIFFDPTAQSPCKEDGQYCVKFLEVDEKAFKRLFPKINLEELYERLLANTAQDKVKWIQQKSGRDEKYILIGYYYYKKIDRKTLYQLEDGVMTWEKPGSKVLIKNQRECEFTSIYRVTLCAHEILEEPKLLNFKGLPFIYVGGNEQVIDGKKRVYPFAEGAIDAQRFKSIALSYFVSAFQNNQAGKIIMPQEANLKGTTDYALKNVTESNLVLYKGFSYNEAVGQVIPNSPPQYVSPPPLPPHYLEAYNEMSQSIQEILGSQYTSLDQRNLSGTALYHLADFMNAAVSPFMRSLLYGVRQLSKIILSSLEFIFTETEKEYLLSLTPMESDLEIDNMDYFDVAITPGVNYKLQQQYAIEQLLKLAELCPALKEWLNAEGIPLLLENIPLNHKAEVVDQFQQFQLKQQQMALQKGQAPSPETMIAAAEQQKAQAQTMKAQADIMDAETKRAEAAANIHGTNLKNLLHIKDTDLKQAHLHLSNRNERTNQILEAAKLHANLAKLKTEEYLAHKERHAKNAREIVKTLKHKISPQPINTGEHSYG